MECQVLKITIDAWHFTKHLNSWLYFPEPESKFAPYLKVRVWRWRRIIVPSSSSTWLSIRGSTQSIRIWIFNGGWWTVDCTVLSCRKTQKSVSKERKWEKKKNLSPSKPERCAPESVYLIPLHPWYRLFNTNGYKEVSGVPWFSLSVLFRSRCLFKKNHFFRGSGFVEDKSMWGTICKSHCEMLRCWSSHRWWSTRCDTVLNSLTNCTIMRVPQVRLYAEDLLVTDLWVKTFCLRHRFRPDA